MIVSLSRWELLSPAGREFHVSLGGSTIFQNFKNVSNPKSCFLEKKTKNNLVLLLKPNIIVFKPRLNDIESNYIYCTITKSIYTVWKLFFVSPLLQCSFFRLITWFRGIWFLKEARRKEEVWNGAGDSRRG